MFLLQVQNYSRRLFFLIGFLSVLSLYAGYTTFTNYSLTPFTIPTYNQESEEYQRGSCQLPLIDPFDTEERFKTGEIVQCNLTRWRKLFETDLNNRLIAIDAKILADEQCCYELSPKELFQDGFCIRIETNITEIPEEVTLFKVFCANDEGDRRLVEVFIPVNPSDISTKTKPNRKDLLNVLVLGIDSVSRANLERNMPLTFELLNSLSAIDLHSYVNLGSGTFPNLVPILTSFSQDELKIKCWPTTDNTFDKCDFIWSQYQKAGYYTSFVEDSVKLGAFEYDKKGFRTPPTEDYPRDLFLTLGDLTGHSGVNTFPFCFGSRLGFEVLLDYVKKMAFQMSSQQRPYFQLAWATAGFHDRLGFPRSGDLMLVETLRWFKTQGYLNNTAVILISDHGQRYGDFRKTKQGALEEKLPFVYFLLPAWFQQLYPAAMDNLHVNRRRLSSPFDLHETLKDLLNHKDIQGRTPGARKSRGISHFSAIPSSRSCTDAGIDPSWCPCDEDTSNKFQPLPVNHTLATATAKIVMVKLNSIVTTSRNCSKLDLRQVLKAEVVLTSTVIESTPLVIGPQDTGLKLSLIIETSPGLAVFESTLVRNETMDWSILGPIARVNSYGNQSHCVQSTMRYYCYCTDLLS